jgi:predicted transcriptional regulator
MATKRTNTRDVISARIGPDLRRTVERVAEAERRTPSSLIRIIVEDWAARVTAGERRAA